MDSLELLEFLPNPAGNDKEGEYFSIINNANQNQSLAGWRVQDASGKAFWLWGSMDSGEVRQFTYQQTKITLNNQNETLTLFNQSSEAVDELSFTGTVSEGRVIKKNLELTPELIQEYFDPLALRASASDTINPNHGTISLWFFTSLIFALLATIVLKLIPKTEAEKLQDEYSNF
ncbi:MAG: hypothetical protein COU09_01185 [Candidatus Harrisonbacteria bacterium CG10_big_fil_rev_8_21_14_0_10_44_23]|uniref:LTD domain-containing protein n=1 Tax=Candidatus Harrisonbacteria bacterium CG10_big_fil_rev_8_21_14_0_10_44_23 TaxID=1974585 RepID=A0A2H0UQA5_9BACT|nr:MAG: hypothetical protein COU09_01185 [Candidatus Harrisonbacteria bacterium CG10_big_fil_rev_8_21_14_0_10_44_23]